MQPHQPPPTPVPAPSSPPGWHPDPRVPGQLRYWDGSTWTAHIAPAGPPPMAMQHYAMPPAVHRGTVGGLTNGQHLLHAIITVCTFGLWAPVWALLAWSGRRRVVMR